MVTGEGEERATVRLRGGVLTSLYLHARRTNKPRKVLYSSDGELTETRPVASHPMSPVGFAGAPGGEYGPILYDDFKVMKDHRQKDNYLLLATEEGGGAPCSFRRSLLLMPHHLEFVTGLRNNTGSPIGTSIGEALYFPLAGSAADIRLGGKHPNDVFADDVVARIDAGQRVVLPNWSGSTIIDLSPDTRIRVSAKDGIWSENLGPMALGMRMRQDRHDGETICLEPLYGVHLESEPGGPVMPDAQMCANGLYVAAKHGASLSTRIELL